MQLARKIRTGTAWAALGLSALLCLAAPARGLGQTAPAAAAPGSSAMGTVKEVSGDTVTLALPNGQTIAVQPAADARIVQLAPGSTSLKTGTPSSMKDIAVGDRVLVRGPAGSPAGTFNASMLVVMKQGDIQQKQEQDLADWQKRGTGGLVSAVNPAASTISISTVTAAGPGKLLVDVTPKTVFRRYAADSVKFEDAKIGSFADVKPGDQLRVRGTKSEDGATLQAEEVVSGSFLNIAGTIASVNAAANTLTLRDLATKRIATVIVTPNSSLHKLPPEMAARFAATLHGAGAGVAAGGPDAPPADHPATAHVSEARRGAPGDASQGGASDATGAGSAGRGGAAASAGISRAIAASPVVALSDLKAGDAVMIVATPSTTAQQPAAGAPAAGGAAATPAPESVTAVTVLAGVEPILAATPKNQPMTLSAWTMGGDVPSE